MELVYNKSKPVAVTGMAFPTGDVNNFVVGSEEGTVYTACRHGRSLKFCSRVVFMQQSRYRGGLRRSPGPSDWN